MTNVKVPHISVTETAQSLPVPQRNQVVIGIIGISETAGADILNIVQEITSVSQAEGIFGDNTAYDADLIKMIKVAFAEGASKIKAVTIGIPTRDASTSSTQGTLTGNVDVGDNTFEVALATIYADNDVIYVGTGSSYKYEERHIVNGTPASGTTVTIDGTFEFAHYIGEMANVITEKASTDYATAITAMEEDEEKAIVICQLNDDTTAGLIKTMCDNSLLNFNTPCVYIRAPEFAEAESDVRTNATAHNSSRILCMWPRLIDFNGRTYRPGENSAALAGVIANNNLPKLNHNFSEFSTVGAVTAKISNMDTDISAGVTPIQLKYGTIHIVRLVTTYVTKDGVPDTTWQEGSVRLNVDYIIKDITSMVQTKFMQKGNTITTRRAIKEEIKARLAKFESSEILVADERTGTPAYKDPVVVQNADDATQADVSIELSPGKPLNFITVAFNVYL